MPGLQSLYKHPIWNSTVKLMHYIPLPCTMVNLKASAVISKTTIYVAEETLWDRAGIILDKILLVEEVRVNFDFYNVYVFVPMELRLFL